MDNTSSILLTTAVAGALVGILLFALDKMGLFNVGAFWGTFQNSLESNNPQY